ncbi:MAG: diguanylate cyclase domain-containing protein [Chloroflexia bacterium]
MEQERIYEAAVDRETGLYDRRTMWSRLAEEVSRTRRYRYPLSLMLISFGLPNSRLAVEHLLQLAQVLKRHTRASDFLARYSEDTLALLLPCTDERGALQLAERIRQLVAAFSPASAQSMGIGVTSAPGGYNGDKIALVEQVEWALRQALGREGRTVLVPAPGLATAERGK